ncbi:MAG: tetratricopeptide repeat protein, partial [Rhodocyclaceae bacterium]|nr:tetratricopeptide repeat protein [Rhodocyclaceae bacterium]
MELPTRADEVWSWIVGFLPEPWAFLIAVLLAGGTAIGAAIQAYRTVSQVLDSMSEAGRVVGSSIQGLLATVQSPEGFRASMSALLGYLGQKGLPLDDQGEFAEGVRYIVQYSSRGAARRKLIRLLKQPKAALAEWRKRASKLDPRIRFYEYMAIARLALTFDAPLAMASLEDARAMDPTAPYPVRLLGYAQMRDANTLNKAKATWEGLLEGAQSWQLDAVLGLANYYIERRDWRPAVDLLRQALTATGGEGPHSLKIANDLANALVGLKEFDEAEGYLGEVLAVSQSVGDVRMQALAHCNLGYIFHQRG